MQPSDPFRDANSDAVAAPNGEEVENESVTTLGPRDTGSQNAGDVPEDTTEIPISVTDQNISSDLLKIEAPLEQESESAQGEVEIELNPIPSLLRDALTRSGLDPSQDDPLLAEAKKQYIATWNLEALRQNAPYLMIDQVWPEMGMVYMPTMNQMTAKVQRSQTVKEAALRLKRIWEEVNQGETSAISHDGSMFEALADFFSAWNVAARNELPSDGVKNSDSVDPVQQDGRPSDKGPVNVIQNKFE